MQTSTPEPDDRDDDDAGPFRRALARLSLQPAWNWLGDTGRMGWAFGFLNLRKSVFRLRRGHGRCPCQDPSDSGLAWQTGCDAVASWHNPARFRKVCPLLGRTPDGTWRCTVDTAKVRPFWGRAFGFFGCLGLGGYLLVTVSAVLFLRGVGYPVHYRSVAWPPDWHEVREARARYFFAKAGKALQAHRPVEALMSLSQSYQLDPSNYSAGQILAQLWESSGADYSSQLFRMLMRDHPEQRAATARAWFGALLTHGDFTTIAGLARERLVSDPGSRIPWLNALLFASRRTGDTAVFAPLLQNSALPSYVRQICAWETELHADSRDQARSLLTQSVPEEAEPYLLYYRIDRLLNLGMADDAWLQLLRYHARLTEDRQMLLLRADAQLGGDPLLVRDVGKLLARGVSTALVESLSALLIARPDAAVLAKLDAAVKAQPLPPGPGQVTAYAGLFCAAGAAGDWPRMDGYADKLRRMTGARLAALDVVGAYFRGETGEAPIERFLPALSILRPDQRPDIDYALFEFSDRRRIVQKAAKASANAVMTAP